MVSFGNGEVISSHILLGMCNDIMYRHPKYCDEHVNASILKEYIALRIYTSGHPHSHDGPFMINGVSLAVIFW